MKTNIKDDLNKPMKKTREVTTVNEAYVKRLEKRLDYLELKTAAMHELIIMAHNDPNTKFWKIREHLVVDIIQDQSMGEDTFEDECRYDAICEFIKLYYDEDEAESDFTPTGEAGDVFNIEI